MYRVRIWPHRGALRGFSDILITRENERIPDFLAESGPRLQLVNPRVIPGPGWLQQWFPIVNTRT
jgi:hypothetical protein